MSKKSKKKTSPAQKKTTADNPSATPKKVALQSKKTSKSPAQNSTSVLIELKNLVKVYGQGETATEVLHSIDLKIYQGEMVAIMGASGSGKSTLMNILGTLDHLTSGDYYFKSKKIDDYQPAQLAQLRNKEIGFVFQSFNLLPRLNVSKNLERPMLYGQIPREERKDRVDDALQKVGLLDKKDKYPLNLSGGQQQRVTLARALVMRPNLILADEPTGALDSKTATMVMTELKQINCDTGTTIVIITHDERVANFADRIIRLQDGRIVKK